MGKISIFIALSLIAVVFGILAGRKDVTFEVSIWSQLFWLTVGTIATTFFVNAVLERDLSARRRKEDEFAFRTFTATILYSLLQIVKAASLSLNQLAVSALESNKKFAEAAEQTRTAIAASAAIEPGLYNAHYLDVASHLRELANRFIRLYSKDHKEMIVHYQDLQELARRWNYKDIFSEGALAYTNSLEPADRIRIEREAEFSREVAAVKDLLKDTATYLSHLARRVADKSGMPDIS